MWDRCWPLQIQLYTPWHPCHFEVPNTVRRMTSRFKMALDPFLPLAHASSFHLPGPLAWRALGRYGRGMAAKPYGDVDPYVLKALPNPGGAIELKHKAPEVTFLGAQDQPDFGTLYVTFYPSETVVELKSLKEYLYQWRDTAVSYERFLDVVYDHLMQVYDPLRLRLVLETRPRGGISSKLTIDSDWAIRGGKEQFRDWVGLDDTW
jgi:7-cyano-7-deazaguanine reductase